MGKISIEDFDRKGFAEVGVKYGIALIALCIVWILILEFVFHWKPFKFSILTIARLFHGKKESKIYCILNVVWWIIFASPFAYSIAVGAITANRVNNTILGLIIAIVPCIILLFLLTFKNYSAMGYKSTSTHYILVGCSVILYVVLEIVIVMIQSPRSWMACGYLLSWPSLAIALISICSSRRILKKDVTKSIMNNDEVKADTIRDNAIGSGELGWIRANTIVLTSLIANGVYALLWAHTEHQTSAICIGFGSLFLDCMIVFSQYNTIEQGRTFQLVFVGFVIKYVVVSFSSRFFYIGHAFLIFFLGTIFISRAIKVWLANINAPPKPTVVEENDDVIQDSVFDRILENEGLQARDRLITDNEAVYPETIPPLVRKFMKLLAFDTNVPTSQDVAIGCIGIVILVIFYVVESLSLDVPGLEEVHGYTQLEIVIQILCLTVAVSFSYSSIWSIHSNRNRATNSRLFFFFIGELPMLLCNIPYFGIDDKAKVRISIFVIYWSISYAFLAIVLYIGKANYTESTKPNTVSSHLSLALSIVGIAVQVCLGYFFGDTGKICCLVITAFGLIASFIALNVFWNEHKHFMKKSVYLTFISCCIFLVLSVLALIWLKLSVVTSIGIAIFVAGIFAIVFAVVWTVRNTFIFTFGAMLIIEIVSFILLAASIAALFVFDNAILYGIAAGVMIFVFFGSLTFYFYQKDDYIFHTKTVVLLILFAVVTIADIVLIIVNTESTFIGVTTILALLFIICFVITTGMIWSQSSTQVFVFSKFFFPVRSYSDKKIVERKLFNVLFLIGYFAIYLWGLFASVFFIYPQFGAMVSSISIFLTCYIITYAIYNFDSKALLPIEYINDDKLEEAVQIVKDSIKIEAGMELPKEIQEGEELDDEEVIKRLDQQIQGNTKLSNLESTLKAQIFITGQVSFDTILGKTRQYMLKHKAKSHFLFKTSNFTGPERREVFFLYTVITKGDFKENAIIEKNNKKIHQQEENRINILSQYMSKSAQAYDEFKKYMSSNQTKKYEDRNFVPCQPPKGSDAELLSGLKWVYGDEYFTGPIIGENSKIDDTIQGDLGDCYLIASMTSMMAFPKIVDSLFAFTPNPALHAVCVQFNFFDEKINVVVDTKLPFVKENPADPGKPKFCGVREKTTCPWWPCLIEKAYAKLAGSFAAINGGTSDEALMRLVGGANFIYDFEKAEVQEMFNNGKLWESMKSWVKNGSIMCAGTSSSDEAENEFQLAMGHAYSIITVAETHGFKLIKMRNPWGDREWAGDWSDNSSKWTEYPEVRDELNPVVCDDGIFWISFEDFFRNFSVLYQNLPLEEPYWYKIYAIHGRFLPGKNDGAKPLKSKPPATLLPQYVMRFTKPCDCIFTFERTGTDVTCFIYAVYGAEGVVKYVNVGDVFMRDSTFKNDHIYSFKWHFDKVDKPWTILVCRNPISTPTAYVLRIYSNDPTCEVEPLDNVKVNNQASPSKGMMKIGDGFFDNKDMSKDNEEPDVRGKANVIKLNSSDDESEMSNANITFVIPDPERVQKQLDVDPDDLSTDSSSVEGESL